MRSIIVAIMLPAIPALEAPSQNTVGSAPLPSQIVSAKKVFISNAGGDIDQDIWSGGPTRIYDQFYAAIKSWGRYELVPAPADADLVFEISFTSPIKAVSGDRTSTDSVSDPQFKLALLDPKTHIVLWTLTSHVPMKIGLQRTRDARFDASLASLVDELKKIARPPAAETAK